VLQEGLPADGRRAQACHVVGLLLAIHQNHALCAAQRDQGGKGHFGPVGVVCEHGLAKNRPSQRHAVQTGGQFAAHPDFHAVRQSAAVECPIGSHHGRHDPGTGLPFARGLRAAPNHCVKRGVDPDGAIRVCHKFLHLFLQRPVQAEIRNLQHHARRRAPPQNGLVVVEPGKNALRVRPPQAVHIQSTPRSHQAGDGVAITPDAIGECIAGIQPGQMGFTHGGC